MITYLDIKVCTFLFDYNFCWDSHSAISDPATKSPVWKRLDIFPTKCHVNPKKCKPFSLLGQVRRFGPISTINLPQKTCLWLAHWMLHPILEYFVLILSVLLRDLFFFSFQLGMTIKKKSKVFIIYIPYLETFSGSPPKVQEASYLFIAAPQVFRSDEQP